MSQEQGTVAEATEEQVPTPEQVEETPVSQPDTNEEDQYELPDEVKERTKRNFERMRQERDEARRLAESLQKNAQVLSPQQVAEIKDDFVDSEGNVDVTGLQAALRQANQIAAQALAQATQSQEEIRKYEQTRQTAEAYQQFPQLNPDSPEYDEGFYKAVRNHLMGEYSENRSATLIQGAQSVAQFYRPVEAVKKQAVAEFKQAQEKREQGPIETGKGASRETQADANELKRRTMLNDTYAIMERLKNI